MNTKNENTENINDVQLIMLDLEWTCTNRGSIVSEIIEIAASKLDANANVVETFQTYVKPRKGICLPKYTQKFTGISTEDIVNAPSFIEAFDLFKNFIGDQKTMIAIWGVNDDMMLNKAIRSYKINTAWINKIEFKNIQIDFDDMLKSKKPTSVKNALVELGDEFSGKSHSALDDVINTAKILKHMLMFDAELIRWYKSLWYKRRREKNEKRKNIKRKNWKLSD